MQQNKNKKEIIDLSLGHIPPNAVEVEKVVLGALMIDSNAFNLVGDELISDFFYDKKNKTIFCAIQKLKNKGEAIDFLTVFDQLKKDGENDETYKMYVYDLTCMVASSAHIETHTAILKEKYKARELISIGGNLATFAYDANNDIDQITQEAEKKLFELSVSNSRRSYDKITDIVSLVLEDVQKAASNKGELTGIPSGFYKLDEITSGFQKSDLIIIAGRPAMGKTAFALSIAR